MPPPKDNKKGGKGGKDDTSLYESPLQPSASGLESLVVLIDPELKDLPFENLAIFNKIPAKARDFSLLF